MVSDASGRGDAAEYMATVPRWHGMVDANAMDGVEVVGSEVCISYTHVVMSWSRHSAPLRRG
jgi:hypothetical protein